MKVIILCGGLGTRLSEETHIKPKPMVEIGGKPILWHIIQIYSKYGHKDFYIALGYKADLTILSDDITTISPEKILKTRVIGTIVGGEFVYNQL